MLQSKPIKGKGYGAVRNHAANHGSLTGREPLAAKNGGNAADRASQSSVLNWGPVHVVPPLGTESFYEVSPKTRFWTCYERANGVHPGSAWTRTVLVK